MKLASDVSEISQALLHQVLFFLIELCALVFDNFLDYESNERIKAFESPFEPSFRLLAQFLRKADGPELF